MPTMDDWDLDTLIFKTPIILFYKDGLKPLTKVVKTMSEVVNLIQEETKHDNPGGVMTIQFQLWFALARHARMFAGPNELE